MKNILVSGGLGFIGSHLVEKLLSEGNKVAIVDNASSNVVYKDFFPKCEVFIEDIAIYKPKRKFDQIYHLASIVGPARVLTQAGNIGFRIMSETNNVCNLALKMSAKLLIVSSSEVYGLQRGLLTEDTTSKLIQPATTVRLAYDVGKLLVEIESLNKAKISDLWVNIVRPFNVIGPRQMPEGGFVLARFVEQALDQKDITVFGTGRQKRSFVHVQDVVEGMMTIMDSNVKNEVFNLGNPDNTTTIVKLSQLVRKLTKSSSRIIHVDPRNIYGPLYGGVLSRGIPNVEKMKRYFGWEAKIFLKDIIIDVINFYKNKKQ